MFTGIIETLGTIKKLEQEGENLHLTIQSDVSNLLKIDQSIAHNGVCLTVVEQKNDTHIVTAIYETMIKTSLGQLKIGDKVNLERCMRADSRIDGHFVQGHVDQTAVCTSITDADGSWYYAFEYEPLTDNILVDKGSICIDGTSLTVVEAKPNAFTVAIIPYTHEHTVFHQYKVGTVVNLEFDMIGKYITKLFRQYGKQLMK